jgi:undecaprenyl diphosphate synthase
VTSVSDFAPDPSQLSESELLLHLREAADLPRHIAIIMDGNGRWAKARSLPRPAGHRAGMKAVRATIEACIEARVGVLTLFAFSSENWSRPADEVSALMHLLEHYVSKETEELRANGVEVHILGDRGRLAPRSLAAVEHVERETRGGTNLQCNVCLSYSSREEIVRAARSLAVDAVEGRLTPDDITEEAIAARLYTSPWGDPDLLIRTSGEYRISNFLLWQLAYSEIYITPLLWPDFRHRNLYEAIVAYQRRDRRFGGVAV